MNSIELYEIVRTGFIAFKSKRECSRNVSHRNLESDEESILDEWITLACCVIKFRISKELLIPLKVILNSSEQKTSSPIIFSALLREDS